MPMRTWLPLTPSTVTVTESPIIRVSPTRRVRINMWSSPWPAIFCRCPEGPAVIFVNSQGYYRPDRSRDYSAESHVLQARPFAQGSAQALCHPVADTGQCRLQCRAVIATALRQVGTATALAADLRGHV